MLKSMFLFSIACLPTVICGAESTEDIAKISESMGHLIGKNLHNIGVEFDIDKVMKGIRDASEGKSAPLTEEQCVDAIAHMQEKAFHQESEKNLSQATAFLQENAKQEGVIEASNGKLQYKVQSKGQGKAVQETSTPLVRYTGKYLDGTVFGSSEEGERIELNETIAGFREGILGMKEGEKRTLFIHPELGYGENGFLKPNSLLTFEIEILQANMDSSNNTADAKHENPEIAEPTFESPAPLR